MTTQALFNLPILYINLAEARFYDAGISSKMFIDRRIRAVDSRGLSSGPDLCCLLDGVLE
jgi:hypothetical protein